MEQLRHVISTRPDLLASLPVCASDVGGALYVLNYDISGSSIFENCSASRRGGAIFAIGLVRQRFGSISFNQCRSGGLGGAVFASHLTQRGHLRFSNCWAKKGRAIAAMKTINIKMLVDRALPGERGDRGKVNDQVRGAEKGTVVLDGSCEFHTCLAGAGGAVSSPSLLLKQNGSAIFEDCHGEGSAGALVVIKLRYSEMPPSATSPWVSFNQLEACNWSAQ